MEGLLKVGTTSMEAITLGVSVSFAILGFFLPFLIIVGIIAGVIHLYDRRR